MKTIEELKNYLLEEIDTSYYDTICELERDRQERKVKGGDKLTEEEEKMTRQDMVIYEIEDFLDYIGIEEGDLQEYKKEDNDFWNDKNKNGNYWADMAGEWADGKVSIYNYDLWNEAPILSDYIEEAISEFGFDKERGIIGVFQMGEYHFYSGIANELLNKIKDYVELIEEE